LAVLAAMGDDATGASLPGATPVQVIRPGQVMPLDRPAEMRLDDGTVLQVSTTLPPDLPLGYHDLRPLDGGPMVHVIVRPSQCYLPGDWRRWGWAVQLYALRSAESWGIGDLVDLRRLAGWSATDFGAGILLINPLHAATPVLPQQPSPYFPSSRRYRNLLYLRIEEVPCAAEAGLDLESHRAKALVVGEDLGMVEEGVQAQLAAHRILSYRVLWFETERPSHYPELALVAITTHDLPTIAGLWSGADLQIQHELGLQPNEEAPQEIRERLRIIPTCRRGRRCMR